MGNKDLFPWEKDKNLSEAIDKLSDGIDLIQDAWRMVLPYHDRYDSLYWEEVSALAKVLHNLHDHIVYRSPELKESIKGEAI